ncbi:hypothetical protein H9P43_006097 [Blastocladiella emersonii ATCC 22665]|nr:hypothetical protein H9P43_006097 [Blastocladiella emersonii ATCC 22665]
MQSTRLYTAFARGLPSASLITRGLPAAAAAPRFRRQLHLDRTLVTPAACELDDATDRAIAGETAEREGIIESVVEPESAEVPPPPPAHHPGKPFAGADDEPAPSPQDAPVAAKSSNKHRTTTPEEKGGDGDDDGNPTFEHPDDLFTGIFGYRLNFGLGRRVPALVPIYVPVRAFATKSASLSSSLGARPPMPLRPEDLDTPFPEGGESFPHADRAAAGHDALAPRPEDVDKPELQDGAIRNPADELDDELVDLDLPEGAGTAFGR